MSRLTSKVPFNKPSVLDVLPIRPVPLSPPETELEPGPPLHDEKYMSPEAPTDTPVSRFRKVSTVPYSSGGLSNREARSSQKQQRWLVMVMPPASLNREPPVLGHTLSSAPAGRFSNGILMPLFPTLYGQLTAIAREFNMPSTTGLCVYLQLQDSGISMMTPRISDESWQLLWGHFFVGDERIAPLPSHGLPISGRIEFDIDLRRAKWFNTWMGHTIQERTESESMSRAHSMVPSHWRGDSRISLLPTEQVADESPSPPNASPLVATISSRPVQRHLPRPLFLERREASSVRSLPRHPSHAPSASQDFSSPENPTQTTATLSAEPTFVPNALSPVVQEPEEPLTAKKAELDSLVLQWRQGSVSGAASTALAAAGQPSLDPVNMPAGTDVELDLNDFAWSISSAGPPSESPLSAHWSEPLPSVHLQGRLQGSVCLTPSVCTSFGPPDYDWPESPVSCVSRRPSPDLGMRMLDVVCLTPTTATSWGPDDHPSPTLSEYDIQSRPPSVDLGVRGMGSRPVTPSTATSWGPPDSPSTFLDSPAYVRTPDVAERGFSGLDIIPQNARPLAYPYYRTSQCWGHVWPYQANTRRTGEQIKLSTPAPRNLSKVLHPEWPDFAALYPSDPSVERSAANKSQPVSLSAPAEYPILELYTPVYPYNLDYIYPLHQRQGSMLREKEHPATVTAAATAPRMRSKDLLPEWPDFTAIYPSDPKAERAAVNKSQPVLLPRLVEYPFFDLYPSVYPHNLETLYPISSQGQLLPGTYLQKVAELALLPHQDKPAKGAVPAMERFDRLPEWPDFGALYPTDPSGEQAAANKCQPIKLPCAIDYPFPEIYPSAYPYNLNQIYPSAPSLSQNDKQRSDLLMCRRRAQVDELLPEWPDFASLYPADLSIERAGANKSQHVALPHREGYPLIVPYPAVYPYSLQEIYPDMQAIPWVPLSVMTVTSSTAKGHQLLLEYPDFAGLYPSDTSAERVGSNKSQPVGISSAGYPFLTIYPSVYPFNLAEIYGPCRSISTSLKTDSVQHAGASKLQPVVALPRREGYPSIIPYPAVHPSSLQEIYPDMQAMSRALASGMRITTSTAIGHQLLPEYPDFAGLYPSDPSSARVGGNKSRPVGLPSAGYPFLTIYPPVYPFNLAEIYTPCYSVNKSLEETTSFEPTSTRLPVYSGYPDFNLYPAPQGFPTFEIYPPIRFTKESFLMSTLSVKLTSAYPDVKPYEPVYPYLVVYPQTQLAITDENLTFRPASSWKRASTPGPIRHHPHVSRMSLTSGEQPDTQHRSSRSPVLREIVPPLPSNTSTTTAAPSINGSPHGKSRQTHLDVHLAVFGIKSPPTLTMGPQHSYAPRKKPKRTHRDLHLLVFGNLSQEDPQNLEDFVPELPSRSAPVPTPIPTRQRSRSGTISGCPSASIPRPARERARPELSASSQSQTTEMDNTSSLRPSSSTITSSSLQDISLNSSDPHTDTVPSSEKAVPLVGRRRAPSVYGLPSSPADTTSVLSRIRSMNSHGAPRATSDFASDPQGPNRSNSLSEEANHAKTNRQSIVLERAKMFMSDQGSKISNDPNDGSLPSRSRSAFQLNR